MKFHPTRYYQSYSLIYALMLIVFFLSQTLLADAITDAGEFGLWLFLISLYVIPIFLVGLLFYRFGINYFCRLVAAYICMILSFYLYMVAAFTSAVATVIFLVTPLVISGAFLAKDIFQKGGSKTRQLSNLSAIAWIICLSATAYFFVYGIPEGFEYKFSMWPFDMAGSLVLSPLMLSFTFKKSLSEMADDNIAREELCETELVTCNNEGIFQADEMKVEE